LCIVEGSILDDDYQAPGSSIKQKDKDAECTFFYVPLWSGGRVIGILGIAGTHAIHGLVTGMSIPETKGAPGTVVYKPDIPRHNFSQRSAARLLWHWIEQPYSSRLFMPRHCVKVIGSRTSCLAL
jgi:hypothetical protein